MSNLVLIILFLAAATQLEISFMKTYLKTASLIKLFKNTLLRITRYNVTWHFSSCAHVLLVATWSPFKRFLRDQYLRLQSHHHQGWEAKTLIPDENSAITLTSMPIYLSFYSLFKKPVY